MTLSEEQGHRTEKRLYRPLVGLSSQQIFQMNGIYRLCIVCTEKEISVYQTIIGVSRFLIYVASCIVFFLSKRITDWIGDSGVIGEEQAGFREGRNTTDHIFTLLAMIQKQLSRHTTLYVAFNVY